jgi:hypothetical protein
MLVGCILSSHRNEFFISTRDLCVVACYDETVDKVFTLFASAVDLVG